MQADRIFKVKLFIGITAVVIFIGGIAVKMIFPKEVTPVLSDINALMTLASVVFGGLVRVMFWDSIFPPFLLNLKPKRSF